MPLLGSVYLLEIEVSFLQSLVQLLWATMNHLTHKTTPTTYNTHLKRYPMDEVKRVDNVAEGFAHLSPVSISDQGVEIHLRERDFPHELLTKEHHSSYPEEQDVMTCLQETVRVEVFQI